MIEPPQCPSCIANSIAHYLDKNRCCRDRHVKNQPTELRRQAMIAYYRKKFGDER